MVAIFPRYLYYLPPKPIFAASHPQDRKFWKASFFKIGAIVVIVLCISLVIYMYHRKMKLVTLQNRTAGNRNSADRAADRMAGANGGSRMEHIELHVYREEILGGGMNEQGEAPPPYAPQ